MAHSSERVVYRARILRVCASVFIVFASLFLSLSPSCISLVSVPFSLRCRPCVLAAVFSFVTDANEALAATIEKAALSGRLETAFSHRRSLRRSQRRYAKRLDRERLAQSSPGEPARPPTR